MRKIFLVFISVCAFFLFYRCGDNTPSENKLKYEVVKYEKQSAGCDSLREDNCAKIKIEFPEITEYENETIKIKSTNQLKTCSLQAVKMEQLQLILILRWRYL